MSKANSKNEIFRISWMEALKKFNAGKGEWCVPKKGTREHKEVISIMNGSTLYIGTRQEQKRINERAKTNRAPVRIKGTF